MPKGTKNIKKYKINGKKLSKKEWIEMVESDLEQQLKYTDDLWTTDDYGTGKGYRIYYKLYIEKD